jgi:hypothetical protein
MPYLKMTGLDLPGDDSVVWRYMDVSKYLSMLVNRGIYFVRCDKFRDTWDSVLPPRWLEKMNRNSFILSQNGVTYTEAEWYQEREIPSNLISCWNVNDHEYERMWQTYTTSPEAIAIQTTIGQLKECFSKSDHDVRIGLVSYGDHDRVEDLKFARAYWADSEPSPSGLNPWYVPRFLKRQEFEFEKEVRATIHVLGNPAPVPHGYSVEIGIEGLRTLIQSIRVKPGSQEWFVRVIESVNDQFGLQGTSINNSALDAI